MVRRKGILATWGAALPATLLLLTAVSCNPVADDSRSALLVYITSINGGLPVESDVVSATGTVTPNLVVVRINSALKNPTAPVPQPGWGSVRLTSYSIAYTRPDGLNEPGVDVPFPLVGGLTEVIAAPGGTVNVSLPLVTRLAKVEPPLRSLWYGQGELEIVATAHISIQGEDFAGNAVRADGQVTVYFADYAG